VVCSRRDRVNEKNWVDHNTQNNMVTYSRVHHELAVLSIAPS